MRPIPHERVRLDVRRAHWLVERERQVHRLIKRSARRDQRTDVSLTVGVVNVNT